jgi:hypothetical protein
MAMVRKLLVLAELERAHQALNIKNMPIGLDRWYEAKCLLFDPVFYGCSELDG